MSNEQTVETLKLINTLLPIVVQLTKSIIDISESYTSENVPAIDELKELQTKLESLKDL